MGVRARPLLLGIPFAAFVSLGLPDAVLGIAWPSIQRSCDLGVLLVAMMVGYLVSSFLSGSIVARFGVGRLLLGSSVLTVLSSVGYAVAFTRPC